MRIYYFCPDTFFLSAGIRRIHRHVEILRNHGFNAAILHQVDGFRRPDFSDIPVYYLDRIMPCQDDVVVIPEGYPNIMKRLSHSPCRRFVMSLNWDYIFTSLPLGIDWRNFNIERVIVVSSFVGKMVSWAMGLPVHLLSSSIDSSQYFYEPANKQANIAFIKRKAACAEPLQRLLCARNPDYVDIVKWRFLDDLPESEYAAEICQASVFLNLSTTEGLPTSCLEAMAAGTLVAGFDGVGGRDILRNNVNCLIAPNGDYVSLAYQLAPILDDLLSGTIKNRQNIIDNGLKTASKWTIQNETESLTQFWESIR